MMQALDKDLRSALEKTVKAARTVAETAANAAVNQLSVGHDKPEAFLSDTEKALRNRLRTHGKQLGDARDSKSTNPTYGKQEVQHLVQEVAYQHWHRMLFARFLADNNLLMYDGVAVNIEECDELAPDEGAKSGWELAGKLAARMLPQVFKPGSPAFELTFAPEHQNELERLLKDLPDAVFKASDSLGWVYQFWQADNKDRINKSEVKIGADELPAVTQLFTEPYMVAFLLHNSLGAWWATRHTGKPCPVTLDYFRTLDDGTPVAGKFEGWPDSLAEFKLLDPCCGSGHFLVAAFLMLVPMRMAAEGLRAKDAVNRVLTENIHGLEIDPRCVEIAVFAIALEAWRYSDEEGNPLGVREIPAPSIACCGLVVAAKAQDWESLVPNTEPGVEYIRQELRQLHSAFLNAPILGSLLDPRREIQSDLISSNYEKLLEFLSDALSNEHPSKIVTDGIESREIALSAKGIVEAAQLLGTRYNLVITNVPYLSRGKQAEALKEYCDKNYGDSRNDLSNVFLDRCIELCAPRGSGVVQIVMPQNWLSLVSFKGQRIRLLKEVTWNSLSFLGAKSFKTPMWDFNVMLLTLTDAPASYGHLITGLDVTAAESAEEKASDLLVRSIIRIIQRDQIDNPDSRVLLRQSFDKNISLLSHFAKSFQGIKTGDDGKNRAFFWEMAALSKGWIFLQGTSQTTEAYRGLESILRWGFEGEHIARRQGLAAWGHRGIAISQMGSLPATIYLGGAFDSNVSAVVPLRPEDVSPIWSYCSSIDYKADIREIDKKVAVATATMVQVPFDIEHWTRVARSDLPNGIPQPYSDDPTQWIFHGHPPISNQPLQAAVALLMGYTWPAMSDENMELASEARKWVVQSKKLACLADKDGIVCIPAIGGESSASDRLLNILAAGYGQGWSNEILGKLLATSDHAGKSLETWLRDKFFIQHCALFRDRPFVWHIWDGLRDGFSVLVNYHKLDYKALESLIYTYLGNWIVRQKRDSENSVDGSQEKLAAAESLKKRLELILVGETPYDIFVRWKPIEEQPIGWNPDLNDGVRLNIRPFLSVPDVGKRGAGVLRDKPKSLHWEKDRGADTTDASWYELGPEYGGKKGDRINNHHLKLADKRKAREKAK